MEAYACLNPQISTASEGVLVRAGRVIVEVFLDLVPLAARAYLNRCRAGASGSLQGTAVHKTMPGLGVYAGISRKCALVESQGLTATDT